jgi:formiminoglutamate deiminase
VTKFWCDLAWIADGEPGGEPGGSEPHAAEGRSGEAKSGEAKNGAVKSGAVKSKVLIETAGGRISAVTCGVRNPPQEAVHLAGFTVPGLANVHSHAFHRALRGRTQVGHGTFWTWRESMYAAAAHLDPDSYRELATAVFAEMALAGVTAVGEFHYLHHSPKGGLYQDPNAMGHALAEAAAAAGIRITLLDTCYLAGGFDTELNDVQRRFSDGDAGRWADRVEALRKAYAGSETVLVGAAVHSVRAVPVDQLPPVVAFAAEHQLPLHVHLSEQRAENDACLNRHHKTPTQLLHDHGALGPRTTAVHATHLSQMDIDLLGSSGTAVCMCPTTERDLADGIGPARAVHQAGSPINLGSDSHAVIDLFEEARAVELDERLGTERRGHWHAAELLHAATAAGHAALGRPAAGRLAPGAPADFATIATDTVRLAGLQPAHAAESVIFAATAADVRHVVVDGRFTVRDHRHELVEDVPGRLGAAIGAIFK